MKINTTKNRPKVTQGIFLAVLLLIIVSARTAFAQNRLSFVYGTNHFNGSLYDSAFVPPSVDIFYLMADHTSMVASRYTEVYYWALTNQLKADWDSANIIVEGQLEILKNNTLIETIDQADYVIQYDSLDKHDTTHLYLDEDAVAARQNFEALRSQYQENLFNYYEEMNAYRKAFQAALAELQAGNITEDQLPEAPVALADMSLFSTDLLIGFPINLPEGIYTVRLRLPDGSIQSDSVKRLVVFGPLREGVGYNVISEERWSEPEKSVQANEIIYSLPGKVIYLEPFNQIEFNELYYTRMNNPQDKQARKDRTVWAPFEFIRDASLRIVSGNSTQDIAEQNYHVSQLVGSALGYRIEIQNPTSDETISFSGFQLGVKSNETHLQMADSEGHLLPQSQREIRILKTDKANWIYVLGSLPLLIGAAALWLRRSAISDAKANEEGIE